MSLARVVAVAASCAFSGACEECLHPPCGAPQLAIDLRLTASAGPLSDAVVEASVRGYPAFGVGCTAYADETVCPVLGPPGDYKLAIRVPGFQGTERTVRVREKPGGRCGCRSPEPVAVRVVLDRS